MMPLSSSLIFFILLLLVYIPSISSDNLYPRTDNQWTETDLQNFYLLYEWVYNDNQPNNFPVTDIPRAAEAQFKEITTESLRDPYYTFDTGELEVQKIMFDTLDPRQMHHFTGTNFDGKYRFIHHNLGDEECDFVIVFSTHGFWVFKIRVSHGQHLLELWAEEKKEEFFKSQTYADKINPAITGRKGRRKEEKGNDREPTGGKSLFAFLRELWAKNGKVTKIVKIMKSRPPMSKKKNAPPVGFNDAILKIIPRQVQRYTHEIHRDRAGMVANLKKAEDIQWIPHLEPWLNLANRQLWLEFWIDSEAKNIWHGQAQYGPIILMNTIPPDQSNCPEVTKPDWSTLWNEAKLIKVEINKLHASGVIQWDQEGWLLGFENSIGDETDPRSAVGLLVLTTKGYWIWLYGDTQSRAEHLSDEECRRIAGNAGNEIPVSFALRGKLHGAILIDIITLLPTPAIGRFGFLL